MGDEVQITDQALAAADELIAELDEPMIQGWAWLRDALAAAWLHGRRAAMQEARADDDDYWKGEG